MALAFSPNYDTLYVLSASSDQIDVINMASLTAQTPISLPTGFFATDFNIVAQRNPTTSKSAVLKAVVSGANSGDLLILNLLDGTTESTLPLHIRANHLLSY